MSSSLKCELLKLKRKYTLFLLLGGMMVQLLWSMGTLIQSNADDFAVGYQVCLYQFPIYNALCLPVLIAILVSNICDMEHKGNTHKQLFTMQEKGRYWNAKWIISFFYILIMFVFQITLIYLIGHMLGFSDTFLIKEYALYFLSSIATSVFITTLILGFTTLMSNQFLPFLIGITIGFLGFMSAFFSPWIMRFIPSSYYMLLSTCGMNWNTDTQICTYYYTTFPVFDFGIMLIIIILFFCIFKMIFCRKEV